MTIVLFAFHPIAETNHGRNRKDPLEIGVVEKIDMHRQLGELQVLHQLVQHLPSLIRGFSFQLQHFLSTKLFPEVLHILFGQVEQFFLIASPGYRLNDPLFRELDPKRQDEFARPAVECFPQLRRSEGQDFFIGLFQMRLHRRGMSLHDRAVLHHEIIDISQIAIAGNRKDIDITQMTADNDRPGLITLQMSDLFSNGLSLLSKSIFFHGQLAHLLPVLLQQRPQLPLQDTFSNCINPAA